jgi:hypothetical protein
MDGSFIMAAESPQKILRKTGGSPQVLRFLQAYPRHRVNVRTKNNPTFRDAQLLLLLYKLRRETRLREARRWFVRSFRPQTAAEFQQLCPAGSEQEESFRMVYSYWEMGASFVTAGILNEELFVHNSSELLLVWSRLQPLVREWRQAWHNPQTVKNIEQVAARAAQYLNEGDPDSHATFISMINGRDISDDIGFKG